MHCQQRVLFGRHTAKRREVVGVVDAQVCVGLNQPGHERHAAFAVVDLRAVTVECFAIASNGSDFVVFHPNLASEWFLAGTVEHVDVCKQVLAHF